MGLSLEYNDGQTPLDEDEKEGLLIPTIATRAELDEFEQQNIEDALQWVLGRTFNAKVILSEKFIRNMHKRMYSDIWAWAGKFRKSNKNLGIDKWQIPIALNALCADTLYWIRNKSFSPDEIAIRFKYRLVSIHCFANGNGRHSRLMADLLIYHVYKLPFFTWGAGNLIPQGKVRDIYLEAVKGADQGNYQPLLDFARS